ncbi:hypothetical protein N7466_007333 [Penicillium verhagenii]|uniref:uncharacterized protein n=1 Tax=Penicillium verhagenii TaxID=1562060 RepID=UPI002545826B|nr:uncharacterized protein N7466_007333 [Penicillium verhagenii]KAJ5928377.1 hypothetical protein N7466_007333 [Penicillium verhagenii]
MQKNSERSQAKKRPPVPCIFDELSAELRFEIFSYLSFEEVLNLRLVCRSLALAAAVGALPRAYWRSRFLPGQDAAFIGQDAAFIGMTFNKSQDWARLFMWIKVCCKNRTSNVGTRHRIWNWLEPIAALAQLENKLSGPHGSVYYGDESNQGGFRGHLDLSLNHKYVPPSLQMRKLFSGSVSALRMERPTCGPLQEGCRALYHRARSLVPQDGANEPIGISIVQLSGRKFIAGIMFPGPENNATDRAIGFHIPSSQKLVNVPHTTALRAIWVAFIPEGLTGIKFVFRDRSSSNWVGETNYSGTVFGTLSIHDGPDWPYLLAGLDYFKIVSLGLSKIEGCPADDVPDTSGKLSSFSPYPSNEIDWN